MGILKKWDISRSCDWVANSTEVPRVFTMGFYYVTPTEKDRQFALGSSNLDAQVQPEHIPIPQDPMCASTGNALDMTHIGG